VRPVLGRQERACGGGGRVAAPAAAGGAGACGAGPALSARSEEAPQVLAQLLHAFSACGRSYISIYLCALLHCKHTSCNNSITQPVFVI